MAAAPITDTHAKPPSRLNLFDAICLIVGIIIGSGIYETPTSVASAVETPWQLYMLWTIGGLVSLCGALCYAELATTYPESGGDVVFLSKAFGEWAGFLFGWLQTFIARPGDISLMALVFARYVNVLVGKPNGTVPVWPAIAVVVLLTALNVVGLRFGKTIQNLLTVGKLIGLLGIVALAFASSSPDPPIIATTATQGMPKGVALILILFTYGGWNEMVYVASEVDQPQRNIWKALVLGTLAVIAAYLLANAAFLHALTLPQLANSEAVATDAVSAILPRHGLLVVAAVIAISSAGAINGLVLTGGRITHAMKRFSLFRWLGTWHPQLNTPVRALLLQAILAIIVISVAKTFDNALIFTSAAVYTFYLATCLSTAVLRFTDPSAHRPFRVPLYPLPLIVFAAGCFCAIRSAMQYRPDAAKVCCLVLTAGLIAYFLSKKVEWKVA